MNMNIYIGIKLSAMKRVVLVIVFGILTLSSVASYAQNSTSIITRPKKICTKWAIQLRQGDAAYETTKFALAAENYEKYLLLDKTNPTNVLIKLADSYWQIRDSKNAFRVYKLLFPTGKNNTATTQQQIRIGELNARFGYYDQASVWLQGVLGYEAKSKAFASKSTLESMKKDSLIWHLDFLSINSSYREFSPFLRDSTLFFTSNRPLREKKETFGWDGDSYSRLWKMELTRKRSKSGKITAETYARAYEGAEPKSINNEVKFMTEKRSVIETSSADGAQLVEGLSDIKYNVVGMDIDKYSHIYFSANYPKTKGRVNRICLMEGSYATSTGVIVKHALPFGDYKSYSVMHPTINPSGTFMVFSSDKPNGEGNFDLYYAQRNNINDEWDSISTFSGNLNTIGNEVFPTLTNDGYLYFSTDARPGLGGLDIFRIALKDALAGKGEPEHLSYPVNSSADDFGWTQDSSGGRGFFTSDRLNDDDLYSFYLDSDQDGVPDYIDLCPGTPPEARKYVDAHGCTLDGDLDGVPDYRDKCPDTPAEARKYVDKDGCTPDSDGDGVPDYRDKCPNTPAAARRTVDKNGCPKDTDGDGVLDYQDNCPKVPGLVSNHGCPEVKKAIKALFQKALHGIQFATGKSDIKPISYIILDPIANALIANPSYLVEIDGHTDNVGKPAANMILSDKRAEAVRKYLISKGVDASHMTSHGFGDTKPVATNKTAVGKTLNRRVEFVVTFEATVVDGLPVADGVPVQQTTNTSAPVK
jgi:outer membrane protein OmpA-like peptidoglycan-associated protein